ncbi:protein TolQ [Denitrobaculum tricleocarpae]|uniref:Tol-Pal system protein TolQ n=1 Tax=Denitrobaculum tricleocarpae TaxID=2591009 RepID=A0A545TX02_9PROT|nr:protein TolQ [Denitrobaculum tricleocarpae]TQV81740.1 protein TolQ [Denitrobaculum tricleocarpae]
MENETVEAVGLAGSVAHDLTVWGLFLQADIVVKIVMVMLLVASVWSWAIIFEKTLKMRRLRSLAEQFEEAFWSGGSLDDLYDRIDKRPPDPMSSLFVSAMREWRRSSSKGLGVSDQTRLSLQQRIERVMDISLGREMERLERHMIFLASVGASAPFIGLFGTVWGIMNAFTSIAASKNTSLAVVAPGIAEALFATALGLVAAIPAVIAYNKISTDLGRYGGRLEAFAGEFGAILSRQLEEKP